MPMLRPRWRRLHERGRNPHPATIKGLVEGELIGTGRIWVYIHSDGTMMIPEDTREAMSQYVDGYVVPGARWVDAETGHSAEIPARVPRRDVPRV